ncbi:MAG: energy-coupling factor ABC transporter ATP-binding protein, partial [Lachnospiraceae bacterium]|nr:energy-coupling factor ABC transporter ATP-binding protein [Lachnospiraceae bacterium]
MEPIIEFKDFSFKYRAQVEPTLRDINLSIMPGEKVLIVGPSGSGKSTLAHCINGLVPFSYNGDITGSLRIEGKNPADLGLFGLSKMVGTVLQDTDGQFIGLTVAEDIAFALENDMVAQDEMIEKVNEVAEMVDVKKLLENAPRELSGGQKQRVSMGGVMVDDVDILLFDE